MSQIGPYSRRTTLTKLDGRTREARRLREIEASLSAHVGTPSATQAAMIDRIARDMLTLELLDARLSNGTATDHDVRTHGGISNRVRLALRDLGMAAPPREDTLAARLARAAGHPLEAAE